MIIIIGDRVSHHASRLNSTHIAADHFIHSTLYARCSLTLHPLCPSLIYPNIPHFFHAPPSARVQCALRVRAHCARARASPHEAQPVCTPPLLHLLLPPLSLTPPQQRIRTMQTAAACRLQRMRLCCERVVVPFLVGGIWRVNI